MVFLVQMLMMVADDADGQCCCVSSWDHVHKGGPNELNGKKFDHGADEDS